MSRRIRLLEEDYEQTAVRLTTASGKLEEASKFAEESERCAIMVDLIDTIRRCTVLPMQSFQSTVYELVFVSIVACSPWMIDNAFKIKSWTKSFYAFSPYNCRN